MSFLTKRAKIIASRKGNPKSDEDSWIMGEKKSPSASVSLHAKSGADKVSTTK